MFGRIASSLTSTISPFWRELKVFVSSLVSVLTRHNISVTAHRIYVDFFSDNNLRAKKSSIIKRFHANKDGGFVDKFPNIDTIYLVKYALVPIKCHCHWQFVEIVIFQQQLCFWNTNSRCTGRPLLLLQYKYYQYYDTTHKWTCTVTVAMRRI